MDNRFLLFTAGLIFLSIPGSLYGVTVDCTPLRPGAPVESSVEDSVKGQANVLLRSLGSGTIENGYRQVEGDTLARYPHADKLLLWREYIYVSCTLLAASAHWSDDDKWEKWMRLMNRWNDAPPADPASPSMQQPAATGDHRSAAGALAETGRFVIGGIWLGTSLAEIRSRNDVRLSLDGDGNPYGEEIFTFTYGQSPGATRLDGDVVFGISGDAVSSITVTHTLHSGGCIDNPTTAVILNEQIRAWGVPLSRPMIATAGATGSEMASYRFRREGTNMVLILQTLSNNSDWPLCRVSMNYHQAASGQ